MIDAMLKYIYQDSFILISIMFTIILVLFSLLGYFLIKMRGISKIETKHISQELEYHHLIHEATECLYENIYELDITHNCAYRENTSLFFESLGIRADTPYDEALKVIANKQIKREYRKGYLDKFSTENVIEAYNKGINTLNYDFMITKDEKNYQWMRITAKIFFWQSDNSIHMITYRKNIDVEKNREILLLEKSKRDSLTNLYNKRATEELISKVLKNSSKDFKHAFLMFDIDNFKNINDNLGHSFGDFVIEEFVSELKGFFNNTDILGRIGGDEFVVMIRNYNDKDISKEQLELLCSKLSRTYFGERKSYSVSSSIGIALFPNHGDTYSELYEKADQALYYSKGHGKGTFNIFGDNSSGNDAFYVNQHDLELLINIATDGISKIAYTGDFKMLYFNQKLVELIGTESKILATSDFNILSGIHPEDLQESLEIFEKAIPTKKPFTINFRLQHHEGYYLLIRLRGIFVDELFENQYPIFYAIYTDITDIASLAKEK